MGTDEDVLKAFLVNLPQKLEFNKPLSVRQNVFKALYYCASNRGQHLPVLFPHIKQEEIDELDGLSFPIVEENQKKVFFNYKSKKESYTHPPNRACTRPFKKGEPVYRCEQCGYDDTCVLCVHCFNQEDHKDHDVYMYLSQGEGGGICDCGDPEAFINPLICNCQISNGDIDDFEIDEIIRDSLRSTIRVCLDYILDVTNFSIQTLPFIHQNINKGSVLTSEILSNYSALPSGRYGGAKDINSSDMWFLVIWNDEHHDFHQATSAIIGATNLDSASARDLADEVHLRGNAILRKAAKYSDLLEAQVTAQVDGLVTTIMSARDYMREVIVRYIFNWLNDIVEFSGNSKFRILSSSLLGELLLEPNFEFSKVLPEEFIESLSINYKRKCFENGLPQDGSLVNFGLTAVSKEYYLEHLMKSTHEILETNPNNDNLHNSRIQFLLTFETRLPSTVRKKLSSILIPPIVEDLDKKEAFVSQFVSIYPQLFNILALSDREEHLNSLHDIATQIFTCPKSVSSLIYNNQIGLILGPIAQIIEEHSSRWNFDSGYPNFVEIAEGPPHTYRSIKKAVTRGIQDIAYLVDKRLGKEGLKKFLERDNLIMFLLFLRNFQGYWPIERKYGDHVEREILDFVVHLEYSLPILNIVKSVATCSIDDMGTLSNAVDLVAKFLNLRKVKKNAPGIADFRVSKDPVSFVNPINSLLSYLLSYHNLGNNDEVLRSLVLPFMDISDISLRSIILGAQVRIGFWIRNGISVSRTATLYTESIMCDSTFYRDMHLNQIACILDEPRATLYNFLDRWELLTWFSNEVPYDKTIYEDRFSSIAEKFIIFVYNLITDRLSFCDFSGDEKTIIKAKRAICYSLSDEPKSFLRLKHIIDEEITKLPNFDSLLKECADYRAPTGLMDSGMYILKPHLLEDLDPFSLQLDSNESQSVMESIIKKIAIHKKIREDDAVLIPKISKCNNEEVDKKICNFTKTKDFAKLLYKFLQVAIDNSDETYMMELLHLIHTIIVDDEVIKGPDYLCENFVIIPICDLLLIIVESNMSKNIVSKADHLVDQFIAKDKSVIDSLTDSFGEDYMKSYKKRKTGDVESEMDLKKKLAEDRKAKIMKKFAKQRDKFLANNKSISEKDSAEENEKNHSLDLRTCVLCGEKEHMGVSFGLLASKTKASSFWKIPDDANEYASLAFGDLDSQQNPKDDYVSGKGYNHFISDSDLLQSIEAPVIATCGHGMHFSCYKRASNGLKFFPCPLCHNLHDLFIPSFLPPANGGGLQLQEANHGPIHNKYNQITSALCETKCNSLFGSFMNADYSDIEENEFRKLILPLFEELLPQLVNTPSSLGNKTYFHYLQTLSIIISDTIRMNEIATRLDGKVSLGNFLTQFPQSAKTLIKSLIQCRVLLFKFSKNLSLTGPDLKDQIEKFWESGKLLDGIFNEVIVLFFQTDESFTTLARFGYTKLITISVYSLLEKCSSDINYLHCLSKESLKLDDSLIDDFRDMLGNFCDHIDFSNFHLTENDFIKTIYYSVERILLPFLRQLIIFKDILTSQDFGDGNYISSEKFNSLEDEIINETKLDSSLALTNLLGLPSLEEMIKILAGRAKNDYLFEHNIFDIVLNAKIPKFLESGILTLQYPGIVKLIELPSEYNSWTADSNKKSLKGTYDYIVCLHCGTRIKLAKMYSHMNSCSNQTNVFYHPRLNNLKICTYIGHSPFSVMIPAPYLTMHGEVKRPTVSGRAILNEYRYNYLNKLWLNQGLHGFITRTLFGSRQQPQNDINDFSFEEDFDEVDDDEVEFIYEDNAPFVW